MISVAEMFRHSLLFWFTDLMNVTEEVTIHRPNVSTLLSSAFIRGNIVWCYLKIETFLGNETTALLRTMRSASGLFFPFFFTFQLEYQASRLPY